MTALFRYSRSEYSKEAKSLQQWLNGFPGVQIGVDGYPGKDTSDAFFKVFGYYLPGDPRISGVTAEGVGSSTASNTNDMSVMEDKTSTRYMNLVPFFLKWEGGLSRDTKDSASSKPCPTPYKGQTGWHTNKGITYATWVSYFGTNNDARFLDMNDADWGWIMKKGYWDKVKADSIPYDSIAYTVVSWAWGSGAVTGVKQLQKVLGVSQDGSIGENTLKAMRSFDEKDLFDKCAKARENFFRYISDPANGKTDAERKRYQNNSKFLKGWLNRLNEFVKTYRPA